MILCLHRSGGFVAKLIRWQTRGKYVHASVILHHETPTLLRIESMQGSGVRMLPVPKHEDSDVDYFRVEATKEQERKVLEFLTSQLGQDYDYKMVLRFVPTLLDLFWTKRRVTESRSSKRKWFCSELVFAAYQHAGISLLRETEPFEVSPDLLSRSPLLIPIKP